jgi:hypothetical protein
MFQLEISAATDGKDSPIVGYKDAIPSSDSYLRTVLRFSDAQMARLAEARRKNMMMLAFCAFHNGRPSLLFEFHRVPARGIKMNPHWKIPVMLDLAGNTIEKLPERLRETCTH